MWKFHELYCDDSSDDPEAVEVQQSDLRHLDPYEFLNDTVIDFYIK